MKSPVLKPQGSEFKFHFYLIMRPWESAECVRHISFPTQQFSQKEASPNQRPWWLSSSIGLYKIPSFQTQLTGPEVQT